MVRPRIGDFVVISNYRLSSSGWAIILLSVAALALGGCGRKGGLDLPPNAASAVSRRPRAARYRGRARGAARRLQSDLRVRTAGPPRRQRPQEDPFVLDSASDGNLSYAP